MEQIIFNFDVIKYAPYTHIPTNEILLVRDTDIVSLELMQDDAYVKNQMKSWSDAKRREFLKSKHVDIVVRWNPESWSHTLEITFDSGYEIKEINAPNPPQSAKDKRKGYPDRLKNESALLLVAESTQYPPNIIACAQPLVTTQPR